MNIVARASANISRAPGAAAPRRAVIPAALAVVAAVAVAGCSSSAPTAPAPPVTATPPASVPPATPPVPASAGAAAPAVTTAPPTPAAEVTPASPAGPAPGSLTARITILGSQTRLVPGGTALRFLVTVTNTASQAYSNVLPLVSLGHCACTRNTMFPAGTLAERESTTNVWQTIPYDVEGFGTDYLNVNEPGGIQMISPGAAATFEYRVALNPATSAQVTRGAGAIDVTLVSLPGHTQIGPAPSASVPVDVQSGQPPA